MISHIKLLLFFYFFFFLLQSSSSSYQGGKKNYSNQFWDVISALVTTLLSAGGWLEMAVTVAVVAKVVATKVRKKKIS